MGNLIDAQYQDLLEDIIESGIKKSDRTGTGTISVFGRQIRHRMSEGFPLLTTKKMAWKTMVTELLWFLRGETNIKFLVDNGCHIWDGDAYKRFLTEATSIKEGYECGDIMGSQPHIESMFSDSDKLIPLTKDEFIKKIKGDKGFAKRDFVERWGELGPIYGAQWRRWEIDEGYETPNGIKFGGKHIDQIANLINELKTNPDSRRLMVNAWNVGELDQMVLPPCHYGFQVYTRELDETERVKLMDKHLGLTEKDNLPQYYTVEELKNNNIPTKAISLMWNQRSVDTFLGLPFNIASYGLLLEILSKIVNMVPEELIGNLGDVHLYSNHIEQAKEQITRTPYELPKLVHMKTDAFYKSLSEEPTLFGHLDSDDFGLENYQSHPSIKAPLSN